MNPLRLAIGRTSLLAIAMATFGGSPNPAAAAAITHYFTINPIQICNDAGTTCAPTPYYPDDTYKIYSQTGIAPIFLPVKKLNKSSLLTVDGVSDVNKPGNGQHANSTTINAWFANQLNSEPGSILFGEAYLGANGLVINGTGVESFPPSGRRDTFAHEVGHNLGLDHSSYGAGPGNNLMTAGSDRQTPEGLADITPDGANLSQLTAAQKSILLASPFLAPAPDVLIDTRGSTPFMTDDFFLVKFNSGPSTSYLKSLTVDISPVNAFFDSTDTAPGLSSSPFSISTDELIGITSSDISLAGGNSALNGKSQLTLNFADNAFKAGDSFRFGVDIDLFSKIDNFGAEPTELIGSLFSFVFSDGLAVKSALSDELISSSTSPLGTPSFIGEPSGGPDLPPGTITDIPDPVAVPVPGPLPLLGPIAALSWTRKIKRRVRSAATKA